MLHKYLAASYSGPTKLTSYDAQNKVLIQLEGFHRSADNWEELISVYLAQVKLCHDCAADTSRTVFERSAFEETALSYYGKILSLFVEMPAASRTEKVQDEVYDALNKWVELNTSLGHLSSYEPVPSTLRLLGRSFLVPFSCVEFL